MPGDVKPGRIINMMKAEYISRYTYRVKMDRVEHNVIHKLAIAYGITFNAMLVGCINKGIDVIGKQIKDNDESGRPWCHG